MKYIEELREGDQVGEVYLCKTKQRLNTKANKKYISLTLQDKTGILDGKIWNETGGIEDFEEMDYIYVCGNIIKFQGALQLNINRVRKCGDEEYNPADYLPTSKKDISEMYNQLLSYVRQIKQPYLKKLVDSFFLENNEFIQKFKQHSAAKNVHHGFIGGLLEHTLNVVKLCDFYADNYSVMNRDLLIAAALFHDIGKTQELSSFPTNDYTNEGQLLGHIYIGAEMIELKIREIVGFPKQLALELKHCILAHHGELEYGSPKKPALIEALALNYADNTDAKLQIMTEILEGNDEKTEWLGFNRFLDTNIKRTNQE